MGAHGWLYYFFKGVTGALLGVYVSFERDETRTALCSSPTLGSIQNDFHVATGP